MKELLDILQATLLGVSIVGGIVAVVTYRRDANRRRAEWLMSVYKKFYEEPQYKRVRFLLDYQPQEYEELRRLVESGEADERADQFVDYLNFFEFVGSLWRLGQISLRDIRMLFEYYLNNLRSHEWVRDFVKTQGFESLDELLKKICDEASQ
jgi:tRNA-dihydrouridine synthase